MCLPAIRAIRETYRESEITLLLQKGQEPLLEGHPDLDRIIEWDPAEGSGWKSSFRWGRTLRAERFDAAVVFNPSRFFHTASFLARIPIRVGYRRKWGFLLNRSIEDSKNRRTLHEVEYNLELARLLETKPGPAVIELPPQTAWEETADRILLSHGISHSVRPIAIHPWTSNPVKNWPLESFLELGGRLSKKGHPVLIIGAAQTAEQAASWKKAVPSGLTDLVDRVPLGALPGLLRRCRLLISNDSGPTHVAAAVGTYTIVVAPRNHGPLLNRWKPWGHQNRILLSPSVQEVETAAEERLLERTEPAL